MVVMDGLDLVFGTRRDRYYVPLPWSLQAYSPQRHNSNPYFRRTEAWAVTRAAWSSRAAGPLPHRQPSNASKSAIVQTASLYDFNRTCSRRTTRKSRGRRRFLPQVAYGRRRSIKNPSGVILDRDGTLGALLTVTTLAGIDEGALNRIEARSRPIDLRIGATVFLAALAEHPALGASLCHLLAARLRWTITLLQDAAFERCGG
jgi:hypothetical protein